MAFRVTNDHEEIRKWIEERGGGPAVAAGSADTINSLSIRFDDSPGLEAISWEEFFDVLETNRLSFRYDAAADRSGSGSGFNFVARESVPALDDTASIMPEDNEMLDGNMFPSAFNDHGQAGTDEGSAGSGMRT